MRGISSRQGCNTSVTVSHKLSAGIPSNLRPTSHEIISASVLLCDTPVCFLHVQLIGTNVWLPKMHNIRPDVDLESFWSPDCVSPATVHVPHRSWYHVDMHVPQVASLVLSYRPSIRTWFMRQPSGRTAPVSCGKIHRPSGYKVLRLPEANLFLCQTARTINCIFTLLVQIGSHYFHFLRQLEFHSVYAKSFVCGEVIQFKANFPSSSTSSLIFYRTLRYRAGV